MSSVFLIPSKGNSLCQPPIAMTRSETDPEFVTPGMARGDESGDRAVGITLMPDGRNHDDRSHDAPAFAGREKAGDSMLLIMQDEYAFCLPEHIATIAGVAHILESNSAKPHRLIASTPSRIG